MRNLVNYGPVIGSLKAVINLMRWYIIIIIIIIIIIFSDSAAQRGLCSPRITRFLDHTQRRPTVGRTPLDEWSACRRDIYLTTQNTHNRQTSMPPVGFEPTMAIG
jgi:hypothetical protein